MADKEGILSNVTHYSKHVGTKAGKFYKTTLFEGKGMLVGLNCLEPGQAQSVHDHAHQDKFYYVIEGRGRFIIGDTVQVAGPGHVVWAEAGILHGVENREATRLVLLVTIALPPK
jgi:quercetin dioxygenase-like cupin family protein